MSKEAPKGEKMTAEGLAKLVASLLNYEPKLADTNYAAVVKELRDALETAEDAARAEGNLHCSLCHEDPDKFGLTAKDWKPGCCCRTQQLIKDAYAKGFADAVARVLKFMNSEEQCSSTKCPHQDLSCCIATFCNDLRPE